MIKYIAAILLAFNMVCGLFIWLEDHDDNRLRVIRLGCVILFAIILLIIIFLSG